MLILSAVIPSRLRNKSRKNEFVRHLERLKSKSCIIYVCINLYTIVIGKRKGEKIESEPEEENNDYISDEEAESAYSQNDIFAEAQSLQSYDFSDDCDDFIVADDEGAIELPPMFNMDTFQVGTLSSWTCWRCLDLIGFITSFQNRLSAFCSSIY